MLARWWNGIRAGQGFGYFGVLLAAPFGLLACLFAVIGLYRLAAPAAGDAWSSFGYAVLFAILGAIVLVCSWAMARLMSGPWSGDS